LISLSPEELTFCRFGRFLNFFLTPNRHTFCQFSEFSYRQSSYQFASPEDLMMKCPIVSGKGYWNAWLCQKQMLDCARSKWRRRCRI